MKLPTGYWLLVGNGWFPKIGGTFLGVPKMRTTVLGVYVGVPCSGKLPMPEGKTKEHGNIRVGLRNKHREGSGNCYSGFGV